MQPCGKEAERQRGKKRDREGGRETERQTRETDREAGRDTERERCRDVERGREGVRGRGAHQLPRMLEISNVLVTNACISCNS